MDKKLSKREQTEAKILETAIRLFSEQGFAGTSTSQIAKEADVAEGTLFKYYPKKIDLLRRMLFSVVDQRSTAIIIGSLDELLVQHKDLPPEAILKAIILDRISLIDKLLPAVKVILTEMQYYTELREIFIERVLKEGIAFGNRLMDLFEAKGYYIAVPRFIAFRAFIGLAMTLIIQKKLAPEVSDMTLSIEAEIDMVIGIFLRGVIQTENLGGTNHEN